MNVPELHRRATTLFGRHLQEVKDQQWSDSTPCTEWDVRALVNHVVSEILWTPPLLEGRTIEEVGDKFEGDVLGDDPKSAWGESMPQAVAAVEHEGAMERIVHLSFGDVQGKEYVSQLFADYLIHSWDLARAIGTDDTLDPDLVEACKQWFTSMEDTYRSAGAIQARAEVPQDADPQTTLLAMFGRHA